MAIDPRAARLLSMLAAAQSSGDSEPPTPEARRASLRALADLAADPPPDGVSCSDLTCPTADGARLAVRRYRPADAVEPTAALVYLHGGGWVAGDLDTHAGVAGALAQASGCQVFALDYRRPPEHRFPTPIEDALAALAWVRREAGALGVDPGRIAIGGDSAGANLAAAACLMARERGEPPAALQLLICPILDIVREGGSRETYGQGFFIDAHQLRCDLADYLGPDVEPETPLVSPLRAASLEDLPPALIHAAECDPFRDEAQAYAERLAREGIGARFTEHPGMIHYFYALPRAIPYARTALAGMGAEVREVLASR